MKIINFGSLNIDHVYQVPHFVAPGETLSARHYRKGAGGKGLNQSVALARAGADVRHAGRIGKDGLFLKEVLEKSGVNCELLEISSDEATGHAMIQVSATGENCIVLYGGANQNMPEAWISRQLSTAEKGDILLLQNEIANLPFIMTEAAKRGMRIFFNPAPMTDEVLSFPLQQVDTLIVNEVEAAQLSGIPEEEDAEKILSRTAARFPHANLLLTLGAKGAVYRSLSGEIIPVPAKKVATVADTTAAGDTFIGYYLANLAAGVPVHQALEHASCAAAICVSRPGAADSIPFASEL